MRRQEWLSARVIAGTLLWGPVAIAQQPASPPATNVPSEEFASGGLDTSGTIQYIQPAGPGPCQSQFTPGAGGTQYDFKNQRPAPALQGQVTESSGTSNCRSPTMLQGGTTDVWLVPQVPPKFPVPKWATTHPPSQTIYLRFRMTPREVNQVIEGDIKPTQQDPNPFYRHVKGTITQYTSPDTFVFTIEQLFDMNQTAYSRSQGPGELHIFFPVHVKFNPPGIIEKPQGKP